MKFNSSLITEAALPKERAPSTFSAFRAFSTQRILIGILLLAALLRVASALLHGDAIVALPGIYDQISYDGLARRVMEGYGFSFGRDWWPLTRAGEPTAHWSYLYTLYITAVYTLFGAQPLVARLLQAVLAGFLHSWLIWRIGRRSFGPTVGLVAAAISALYAYFVYYAGALLTEPFYMIGILWTFDVALRLAASEDESTAPAATFRMSKWLWLELGVAIGVTALLRQVFLFFIPFLFLWLWWNLVGRGVVVSRHSRLFIPFDGALVKGLALTVVVIGLLIAPWSVRNYRAFGMFVPLNTNSGYAFFWGNHPIYGTTFMGILPGGWDAYTGLIPVELRHLNEAELDRALLKRGIGFVWDDPVRYALLSLSRTREYIKFWPSSESHLLSNVARVGSFGLCLPFMLYGLWVAGLRAWRTDEPRQRAAFVLLVLFITVYSAIHLLTWTLIRYRLPVDALLVIFAAVGLVQFVGKFQKTQHQ